MTARKRKTLSTSSMFDAATVKGTIDTIPETPGLAVWQDGHIGVYIGNPRVKQSVYSDRHLTQVEVPFCDSTVKA